MGRAYGTSDGMHSHMYRATHILYMYHTQVEDCNRDQSQLVWLDVGGSRVHTTHHTLSRIVDNTLGHLLEDTWRGGGSADIFIDRDPMLFQLVMDYLRDGTLHVGGPGTPAVRSLPARGALLQHQCPQTTTAGLQPPAQDAQGGKVVQCDRQSRCCPVQCGLGWSGRHRNQCSWCGAGLGQWT